MVYSYHRIADNNTIFFGIVLQNNNSVLFIISVFFFCENVKIITSSSPEEFYCNEDFLSMRIIVSKINLREWRIVSKSCLFFANCSAENIDKG